MYIFVRDFAGKTLMLNLKSNATLKVCDCSMCDRCTLAESGMHVGQVAQQQSEWLSVQPPALFKGFAPCQTC